MNISEAALRYLEHRPRTEEEMRAHLVEKGFSADAVSGEINELKDCGYINDVEYVIAYLNYGFSKGKGMKLIRFELHDKGISNEDMEQGLLDFEEEFGYDMEEEERARAYAQAQKVVDRGEYLDERMAMKVARRLSSKGYESSTIWSVIDEMRKEREAGE